MSCTQELAAEAACSVYLQCTTIGPLLVAGGGRWLLTSFANFSIASEVSGIPMSGHAKYANCLTVFLVSPCRGLQEIEQNVFIQRYNQQIHTAYTVQKHAFIWILKALPIFCHAVLITQGTVLDTQVKKNQTILQDILVYGYKHFHALVQHRNAFWGTLMLPAVNNNRPGIIVG